MQGKNGQAKDEQIQRTASKDKNGVSWSCIHCIKDWDKANLYALRQGVLVSQKDRYCGVGLLLKQCEDISRTVKISYIQFGSPAHFSGGLAVNDCILDVDGIPVTSLQQAAERIMGEADTLVRLRIVRCSDRSTQHVVLLRQVAFPSQLYEEEARVGLGVVLAHSKKDPHPRVVEILPGSSATLPGIPPLLLQDRVSKVNGRIKGPRFTRVEMEIERDGAPLLFHLGELLSAEWMERARAYVNAVQTLQQKLTKIEDPGAHEIVKALREEVRRQTEAKQERDRAQK